jgi:hypothetical protein
MVAAQLLRGLPSWAATCLRTSEAPKLLTVWRETGLLGTGWGCSDADGGLLLVHDA